MRYGDQEAEPNKRRKKVPVSPGKIVSGPHTCTQPAHQDNGSNSDSGSSSDSGSDSDGGASSESDMEVDTNNNCTIPRRYFTRSFYNGNV